MMMETVLDNRAADTILTGGLVGNIFPFGIGQEIGEGSRAFITKSGYDEFYGKARALYEKHRDKILLPVDLAEDANDSGIEAVIGKIPTAMSASDIGSNTATMYAEVIQSAKTVFVNGPMGVFEKPASETGTKTIWDALGTTAAYTVIGGGDSITATAKYGKTAQISFICTGGGALIRFLSGEELPVVAALRHGAARSVKCS